MNIQLKILTKYLQLLRVKQYIKNVFIFLPSFFAMKFLNYDIQINNIIIFFSFSLLTSAVYIINDILDRNKDRKHPKKKLRPIASGQVSIRQACILICFILFTSLLTASSLNNYQIYLLMGTYFLINILYVFWLKNIGIIDVFSIASGFVIRILIGGVAGEVFINKWILIMTFLLALFLGFAKRRDDFLLMKETGTIIRKSVEEYNLHFINASLFITSSITLIAYLMYTISEETISRYNSNNLYITSVFVFLGILRYLQITMVKKESGSPTEVLYADRLIQLSILGWVLSFGFIMYT